MSVSCECCVLSGRGFCYELITRAEKSKEVARRCVRSRNHKNEKAMAPFGQQCHRKDIKSMIRL
jgi:hypothetical protein